MPFKDRTLATLYLNIRSKPRSDSKEVEEITNLSNEIDYNEIKKLLPKNITPAHDGLTVLI